MMRTVRELLLVRDVSKELFFHEDTNGNGLLDPNEDDGNASPPMDNADGRLDRGWLAWITIYSYESNTNSLGSKRLNIKTADAAALSQTLGSRLGRPTRSSRHVRTRNSSNSSTCSTSSATRARRLRVRKMTT